MEPPPARQTGLMGRTGAAIALLVVCVFALMLRFDGLYWPKFHPDEHQIADWLEAGGPDRLYAGGFFLLMKPVLWGCEHVQEAADRVRYFCGAQEQPYRTGMDLIMVARQANVWFGILTCLFVYLLARNVTRSRRAGVLAAALFGFNSYNVEHGHYGETDVASVLMLAAGLWLWSQALDRRRLRWFVAAALALGFAAGTKFTLLPLLPPFLIYAALHASDFRSSWRWRGALALTTGGLAAFALAFAVANPSLFGGREFLMQLAHERDRLGRETNLNMGEAGGAPALQYLAHLKIIGRYALSMGWGWLTLAAVAAPLLLARPFRRYWTLLVLFPAAYLAFCVFGAPWVRSQEFMNFLPILAVAGVAPLVLLWRSRRVIVRAVAVAAAVAAVLGSLAGGLRTASIFGWKDTRELAERWWQRHEPPSARLVLEHYTFTHLPANGFEISTVEFHGIDAMLDVGAQYLVANEATGRGIEDPLTGRRYPRFESLYQDFLARSERLVEWGITPPRQGMTAFNSWTLELFGLKRFPAFPAFEIPLPQPAFVSDEGRDTFFPFGRALGSATAIRVDRYPRVVAVGGPRETGGPVYVVLDTQERPADVKIRAFGRRLRVHLDSYDAKVLALERPAWHRLINHWPKIEVRAEPVEHVTFIPCFMRVAFSRGEAARILAGLGRMDRLRDLKQSEGDSADLDTAQAHTITGFELAARILQ